MAEILDLEETQVRRLVNIGELEAHRIGKRGIRIFLDAVAEYQKRNTMIPASVRAAVIKTHYRRRFEDQEIAITRLKEAGLLR